MIWFLSDLLDSWKNFHLQNFFVNCRSQSLAPSNQNRKHFRLVWCYGAKHHDCGWMVTCWHSAVFRDSILKHYDAIILFVQDRINGESLLIGKDEDSILVIIQVIHQTGAPIQTLLNRCSPDASESLLHLKRVNLLDTEEIISFIIRASLVNFWGEMFLNAFLMTSYNLNSSWLRMIS